MTDLTPHFDLSEFAQPARHNFPSMAYPNEWIKDRLLPLCKMLEILRAEFGTPMLISSGFRSTTYNQALVGSAKKSQHVQGRAADIKIEKVAAEHVHDAALRLIRSGKLPLVKGLGSYPTFTHLDIRPTTRLARWSGSRVSNAV